MHHLASHLAALLISLFFILLRPPPRPPLFPYTTLFRSSAPARCPRRGPARASRRRGSARRRPRRTTARCRPRRSEEHTSELQSRRDLVCRLLLEKKKKK